MVRESFKRGFHRNFRARASALRLQLHKRATLGPTVVWMFLLGSGHSARLEHEPSNLYSRANSTRTPQRKIKYYAISTVAAV
eukprot:5216667-Pleurochrysis_carterae.AAC.2